MTRIVIKSENSLLSGQCLLREISKLLQYCAVVRNFPFFQSYQDQIKLKNTSLSSLFFRKRNTDDNTPLNFFDEIEIHPLIIDVEDDVCPDMFPTIYQCLQRVGPPRNYGEICLWHCQICRLSSGWADGFPSLSRKSMYIRVTFLTESLPSFCRILTLDILISSAFTCTSRFLIPFTQITTNCNLWNLENEICIFYIYKLMYVNSFLLRSLNSFLKYSISFPLCLTWIFFLLFSNTLA